jgi:ABC-type antimicrobial peptide transport system permease subunit
MEQVLYDDQSTGYALITLFVAFAVFALCMAGVGIYGVMSYAVSQRAGEISIRLALGAKAGDVRMMVLRQGGKLIVIGGAAGMMGAVVISRLLSGIVFGISTLDPVTFVGVPTVLMSIGLLANYLPARRATRIDPMRALRVE